MSISFEAESGFTSSRVAAFQLSRRQRFRPRALAQDLHQYRSILDLDDAKLTDAVVGHAIEFAAIENQPAFLKGMHRIAPDTEREAVAFAGWRIDLLQSLAHGKIVKGVHLRAGTNIADNGREVLALPSPAPVNSQSSETP